MIGKEESEQIEAVLATGYLSRYGDDEGFRRLNDAAGECGTLLILVFRHRETAEKATTALASKALANSRWHVYFNMEHVLRYFREIGREYRKGSLPIAGDLLDHSLNTSLGVVDPSIGSAFNINIHSSKGEIDRTASRIVEAVS